METINLEVLAELSAFVEGLDDPQQATFWALVAHNLTISARDTYVPQTNDIAEPAKLRAYNEIMHRVSAQIVAKQSKLATGFPTADLVRLVMETSVANALGGVKWAVEQARAKCARER